MAINFPTTPADNDIHTENGSSWQYKVSAGGVWVALPVAVTGPAGADGDPGTNGTIGANGITPPITVTVEYPVVPDKVPIIYTESGLVVRRIQSVLQGTATPNVVFQIRYASDISAAGTNVVTAVICTNTTHGLSTTSFDNATVPANNWIWFTTSVVSGTVNTISVSIIV